MDQSVPAEGQSQPLGSTSNGASTTISGSSVVVIGANNNNNNMNGTSGAKSTIRVEDSHDLDEMFRLAISQAQAKSSVHGVGGGGGGGIRGIGTPMRQRNLPASFFNPPETGSRSNTHSRESSFDQSGNNSGKGGPFSPTNPASPMSCPMSPGLMANLSIQGSPSAPISTSSSSLSNNSVISNGSNGSSVVPPPSASPLPPSRIGLNGPGSNNGSNQRINIITNGANAVTISSAAPGLMSVHSRAHSSPAQLTAFFRSSTWWYNRYQWWSWQHLRTCKPSRSTTIL